MKIAVVGAGLGGCITAMYYGLYNTVDSDVEVTIYHDPDVPIERVGQGTTPDVLGLIYVALNNGWYGNNKIKATEKIGILYKDWAKEDIFHAFASNVLSAHYVPGLLKEEVLKTYNVVEKNIKDPEKEIDADYIFDCRGRPKSLDDYYELTNPINSVLLATGSKDSSRNYTDSVATPDGWTFVVPNQDSTSYGYLYNNTITSKEEATYNMMELFDVEPDGEFSFNNYIAKSVWKGERTILNGNMLAFLEPLEATSGHLYMETASTVWKNIIYKSLTRDEVDKKVHELMWKIETFVLWHYQNGSKYDTPFWEYAKSLPFNPPKEFIDIVDMVNKKTRNEIIQNTDFYAIWQPNSFKTWAQGSWYR